MRAGVEKLSREMGQPKWYQILEALVEAMKPYARHGVNVNVDFYAGVVYYLNGIPADLFVPIFAVGRCPAGPCRCSSRWRTTSSSARSPCTTGPSRAITSDRRTLKKIRDRPQDKTHPHKGSRASLCRRYFGCTT